MPHPLYLVDAFASTPFTGNPAAICIPNAAMVDEDNTFFLSDEWHQQIAAEMNQAETAFLIERPLHWDLRWFTPLSEVDLCGHATLASAHILWETGRQKENDPICFMTRSGKLTCTKIKTGIAMDFPSEPPVESPTPVELLNGLGVKPIWVGKNRMDYFAVLDSEETVRQLIPDLALLAKLPCRGTIITAKSSGKYDFISRTFFPQLGVPEDHVCGSAHCCLGPYWREKLGKDELHAFQASKRGGEVHVKCVGDRMVLSGRAITTLRGELL